MTEPSIGFVCAMGVGIVFIGLVCIVFITWLMGLICGKGKQVAKETPAPAAMPKTQVIENKQEILAAVSAAVAEELGRDVSAIRILSFKKM